MFPGKPGQSHLHSFFGIGSTDANTTPDSLLKSPATTCKPVEDHSSYWMPSLTDKSTGAKGEPSELIVYCSLLDDRTKTCASTGHLHFIQRFPDCWDGKNLDSPDHKSHVSYGAAGTCPAAFPVRIPAVTFVVDYATTGSPAGFELASGMASSMHFDGFFAWDTKTMADLVKSCVDQLVTCNKEKQF